MTHNKFLLFSTSVNVIYFPKWKVQTVPSCSIWIDEAIAVIIWVTKGFHEMWNVRAGLLFVPVIINPLGVFFHRPKNASALISSKFPVWQLYSEGFYYVLVKAGIYVILGRVLCFDSVLLPCLTDMSPISGLPPESGQCRGVSRVRGQPSWSTTKKEKQEEL